MSLPANGLTQHTARVGACRLASVRLGFVATSTQDHETGAGAPNSTGGDFIPWKEKDLPTTTWTVIREA